MSDDHVWTAEELERMSPAERQRLLDERVVTDLSTLPDEFVSKIRREGSALVKQRSTAARHSGGG